MGRNDGAMVTAVPRLTELGIQVYVELDEREADINVSVYEDPATGKAWVDDIDIFPEHGEEKNEEITLYMLRHLDRVVDLIESHLNDDHTSDSQVCYFAPLVRKPKRSGYTLGYSTIRFMELVKKYRL